MELVDDELSMSRYSEPILECVLCENVSLSWQGFTSVVLFLNVAFIPALFKQ